MQKKVEIDEVLNYGECTLELRDYFIQYGGESNTKIKLIGIKQLLLSKSAQKKRINTFD